MLVQIPEVLSVEQVRFVREKLETAGEAWVDGRATAGHQGLAYELGRLILPNSRTQPALYQRNAAESGYA
ncbi:hypothetical protein [Candidatus Nitrotoga arctica]|uniref:Uncharacterized protein n=1 Tax=Candidatus Nitrotoga arctica TaxID=453162 RepID=A0ABN8AN85_9PROT|nr:hypothetical protein [Candidatus Nitrotoga arctica]CAG9933507.1 protein of unknown function [Candidatus Nitrotoga arctica]